MPNGGNQNPTRRWARKVVPVVPYNPGLLNLVKAKNQWQEVSDASAGSEGAPIWRQRGYLPHRDGKGLLQFVTWRLADAFPGALRSEWKGLLEVEDDPRPHPTARSLPR
jgi:hypothetical protein